MSQQQSVSVLFTLFGRRPRGVGGLAHREEEGEQEGEGKAKDSRENLLKKRKRLKDCA